jgi:hypothetical protein
MLSIIAQLLANRQAILCWDKAKKATHTCREQIADLRGQGNGQRKMAKWQTAGKVVHTPSVCHGWCYDLWSGVI